MSLLFPRLHFADDHLALRVTTDGDESGAKSESLSYAALSARVAAFIAQLERDGVGDGDRVAVLTYAHVDTVVAIIGAILRGVAVVPLNPKLGPKERGHILADATPAGIYVAAPFAESLGKSTVDGGPTVRVVAPRDADSTIPLPERKVDGRPALVLYTSGTTGMPKGAVIKDRQIAANIDGLQKAWDWTDRDVVVHALPLFHVHGLVLGLFGSLRTGGALWTFRRFDADAVAGALGGEGTMLFSVPTMIHRLADAAEKSPTVTEGLRGARVLISGSAGLPAREHRRMEKLVGRPVFERYGLTETLINCAVPVRGGGMPAMVGFPLPGVELKMVNDVRETIDADDGEAIGEIAVRGPSVFEGYLNRPDATTAAMDEEGWFYTGDLATRNADGAIRIVGRRSVDLIKTGGYKVGAGEVEACILEMEGVGECAVVGVPDDDLGQRIEAFLVLREGTTIEKEAVTQRVAEELTPHKRPRAVHFVDSLPRNAMGKVQKKRLLP